MPTDKRVDKRSALFDSTELESAKKLSDEIKILKKALSEKYPDAKGFYQKTGYREC